MMLCRTALLALTLLTLPAMAQKSQTASFSKGANEVTLQASITGGDYSDYFIAAKSGQILKIDVKASSMVFFNVLLPNSEVAIHNSSYDFEMSASLNLPRDGTYVVRVYLQGADESDNTTVPYAITFTIPQKAD